MFLQSFFTIYRNLFSRIAQEEYLVSDINLPPFGDPAWPWAALKGQETGAARDFYNIWLSFVTSKDFSWTEQWNTSDAPDRRVRRWPTDRQRDTLKMLTRKRRLMDKDNRKARDDARRDYSDTVRARCTFSSSRGS
jgi:DnaJ homolog subfamily A member 5